MWTISRLAKRFGLSRSTLLYYDSIGLLRPSRRTAAGYRVYVEADARRMERIEIFRRTGLPLAKIRALVDASEGSGLPASLELRLREIDDEIGKLRVQQRVTLDLLGRVGVKKGTRSLDKAAWVAILRASGMDEAEMTRWHVEFERLAPAAHQDFLESLGIGDEEIARIRGWSREGAGEEGTTAKKERSRPRKK